MVKPSVFTSKNVYEVIIGSGILLIGISGATIISNNITKLLFPDNIITNVPVPGMVILISFVHIVLLVIFTLITRFMLLKMITNTLISNSILAISGPLIGACSLFLGPSLGVLIKSVII